MTQVPHGTGSPWHGCPMARMARVSPAQGAAHARVVPIPPQSRYLLSPPGGAPTCPGSQPPAPGEGKAGGAPPGWRGALWPRVIPSAPLWGDSWVTPGSRVGGDDRDTTQWLPTTQLGLGGRSGTPGDVRVALGAPPHQDGVWRGGWVVSRTSTVVGTQFGAILGALGPPPPMCHLPFGCRGRWWQRGHPGPWRGAGRWRGGGPAAPRWAAAPARGCPSPRRSRGGGCGGCGGRRGGRRGSGGAGDIAPAVPPGEWPPAPSPPAGHRSGGSSARCPPWPPPRLGSPHPPLPPGCGVKASISPVPGSPSPPRVTQHHGQEVARPPHATQNTSCGVARPPCPLGHWQWGATSPRTPSMGWHFPGVP